MVTFRWGKGVSIFSNSQKKQNGRRGVQAVMEAAEARVLLSGTSYTLNTLYTFDGNANGGKPQTGLVADSAGNLYGTTGYADQTGYEGTVFEIPAGTSTPTTLHTFSFGGGHGDPNMGPLIYDGNGHLFGTTDTGGDNGDGSVYEVDLTQNPIAVTTVASFDDTAEGGIQGESPRGTLAIDGSGNIFGATDDGGANDEGTIFEIPAGTGTIQTIYSFNDTTSGVGPESGLIYLNGELYGTTPGYGGGDAFQDTVFQADPSTDPATLTTIANFTNTGNEEINGVVADSSGNLYTSTYFGGDSGSIFELAAGTFQLSTLATLSGDNNGAQYPNGTLSVDADGNLYGVAYGGGTTGDGAVFEVDHTTHVVTTIASLDANTSGSEPEGQLLLLNNNIYGTANEDGNNDNGFGTVFDITAADPPAKLAFAQQEPTTQVANGSLNTNVTVDVEDAGGNIIQTDNSTVTLSVATPAGAAFGADSTITAQAVNGVATFDNLILNTAGTYTLTAADTDGGTALAPPTNATPFTITHAGADQLAFAVQPSSTGENTAIAPAVVVNVEDAYGNIVTDDASAVTLGVATGPSTTLSGNVIAANQGVATFPNLSIADAGIYTLSATDGSLDSTTSNSFTITGPFGAAARLVFSDQPADTTVNSTFSDGNGHAITVEVEDANGNVVVTDNSSVTLALSPSATLGGTLTEPVVNGVATFPDLFTDTAGTYTLAATDASLAGTSSNSFLVSPGSATGVNLINPPTTTSSGGPTTLQAGAQDQYGNIVTSYSTPITVTANGPSGTTPQSFTLNPTNGVATFTITLSNPGSYSFNINSGSFSETAASPITLTYTQPTLVFSAPINSQIVAGDKIAPITLTLYNASGLITNAKPKVAIGILNGPNGGKIYGKTTAVGKNGQVTFKNLSIRKADPNTTYTLEVTSVGYGTGVSNNFTVVPNAVKKMVVAQQATPNPVAHGSPFSMEVELVDKYGNIATNDSSTVSLVLGSHPKGSSLAGVFSEPDSGGVADFTDLLLDTPGGYTLKATDGKLKATSKKFGVT